MFLLSLLYTTSFAAGNIHLINLQDLYTLNGNSEQIEYNAQLEDTPKANNEIWVYGCTRADWLPDNSTGAFYVGDYAVWNPGCGWYDCDKVLDAYDSNLCWAATCANMLHWWLDQNSINIKNYGKYKGPENRYKNCSPITDQSEGAVNMSPIFDWFKNAYGNVSRNVQTGIEKFLISPAAQSQDGGFFSDIFPESNNYFVKIVSQDRNNLRGGLNKELLTKTIKEAISNKEAIGMSIQLGRAGHAVTVWGARLDSEGYVTRLFICDNNTDYLGDINAINIVYDESQNACLRTTNCPINHLALLGTGTEQWRNYFGGGENGDFINKISDNLFAVTTNNANQIAVTFGKEPVAIYDSTGRIIFNALSPEGEIKNITMQNPGLYIIKSGTQAVKVLIR